MVQKKQPKSNRAGWNRNWFPLRKQQPIDFTAGYNWRASGENVASGQRDADAVVAAWLESPGHCANIMEPNFTEMGVAFVEVPGANPSIYWAQSFAAPH